MTPLQRESVATPPSAAPPRRDERSIGELFAELASEIGTLVRQEIKLAKTEMNDKARRAGRQVGYILFCAVLGVAALLTLIAALVFGIAMVIDLWKSALIVGIVTGVVALILAWKGMASLRDMSVVPRQTVETLREDRQWVREQVR